jgi:hypothetical protein
VSKAKVIWDVHAVPNKPGHWDYCPGGMCDEDHYEYTPFVGVNPEPLPRDWPHE